MADNKRDSAALANALVASGEDLPLLQPEPPPESTGSDGGVSLENPMDILGGAPNELDAGLLDQFQDPSADAGAASPGLANESFSESDAAFSDIRNFGEGNEAPAQTAAAPVAAVPRGKPTLVRPPVAAPVVDGSAELPMSTSDTLPGFRVERYLGLVSAWAALDSSAADPLAQASAQLCANAQARGGNGILSVKFQPAGQDGQGLLLVGTAVVVSGE